MPHRIDFILMDLRPLNVNEMLESMFLFSMVRFAESYSFYQVLKLLIESSRTGEIMLVTG